VTQTETQLQPCRILAISGKLQSGKSTAANFVIGNYLYGFGLVKSGFAINKEGQLHIGDFLGSADFKGVFDVTRNTEAMRALLADFVDPYVKLCSFAEPLKLIAVNYLGLTEEQVNGTNAQKNTLTKCKINGEFATGRQVMQWLGKNLRELYEDVYVNNALERIQKAQPLLAIVNDVRFPNEVKKIQQAGGKVIRLTRAPYKGNKDSQDDSETALDPENFDWSQFDYILDNEKLSINKMTDKLLEVITGWDMIPKAEKTQPE